jgi:serine/threonine-protein kinase
MSRTKSKSSADSGPVIEIGHIIAEKYRVEAIIGSGGMGVVLSARHIAMNNRVAIKVLKLDEDADREEAVARFQREARAAARIESEHVVRVMDVAALPDGTPYMVMEYLDGVDLRRVSQERHRLPIEEAVDYVIQACEGLAEAHAAGVIHRDLKPSNLFLARRPNGTSVVKVLDFGISKVAPRADEVAMTTTNTLMGSPLYMAPEQMRSSKDVDARADIWSLGLILYELLAADLPFGGETIPEICVAVMQAEPQPMNHFRNDVPQALQAILLKCMEKHRDDRYPSTAALARDLARFASDRAKVHADRASASLKAERPDPSTLPEVAVGVPSVKKPAAAGGIVVPTPGQAIRPDPETQPSWSRREGQGGRKRSTWIAVGAALCVVAAIGGTLVARTTGSTPPASPSVAAPSVTTTTRTVESPASPPKDEIASVPFDSLPAVDAGAARPPRAPVRGAPVATSLPPAQPAPSASSHPAAKDDWKWGDRN